MFALAPNQLDRLPALRAVFYAAGSVRSFATSLLARDILVVSAWAANAVPVAEFTLAQILLANKGYFRNVAEYRGPEHRRGAFSGRGNFGATVSLLGAGQIGRKLIELLRPFHLRVLVWDPFLSPNDAEALGVEKVQLSEAFARGDVVSNHLANVPDTVGLLNGALFASLPPNATFINTGRGATVNEPEMIRVLRERPDLFALLDVTDPEPPAGRLAALDAAERAPVIAHRRLDRRRGGAHGRLRVR
jgi:phosphoglycerate dehydrogenase-like enzyme